MLEIFNTNIHGEIEANIVVSHIRRHFPKLTAHVDIYDRSKTLVIQGVVDKVQIELCVRQLGFDIVAVQ